MPTVPIPPEFMEMARDLFATEQVRIGSIYGNALTDSGSIEAFARVLAQVAAEQYRAGMEAAAQIGASETHREAV